MRGRPTSRKRPDFGARLAALRSSLGLTQKALARKLRIKPGLLRYYERDSSDPKVSFVIRCAEALGVSASWLCGGVLPDEAGEPAITAFNIKLASLQPKQRALALRLFTRQLAELKKTSS